MAKLTRVTNKIFAESAVATEIGQFGSSVAGSKLETSDVATIQALSAWLTGWSKALVSGNRYATLEEFNGILKVLSYQGAYQFQEGIAEYDSATTYFIGSIVKKTGTFELYGSLTDNNVGNALTVDTEWQFLCDLSTVGQNIIPQGTCSTASATAAKTVTIGSGTSSDGLTIEVTFTNANTTVSPTLNYNSEGAFSIASEDGTVCSATNPFYVPAGATVEFTKKGSYWVYKNRVVTNYVNGTSCYRQWANGFIEQSGINIITNGYSSVTLLKPYLNINYKVIPTLDYGTIINSSYTYADIVAIDSKTINSFRILGSTNTDTPINNVNASWEANGY